MLKHCVPGASRGPSRVSSQVLITYSITTVVWLVVSVPFIWEFGTHRLIVTLMRVFYFATSAIILYFMLHRGHILSEKRQEYDRIFNSLLEPVLIHADGVIRDVNVHALRVFEANSKQELIGQPMLRFVHPDFRDEVMKRITQLNRGKSTKLLEEKFVTLQGNIRDVEIAGIPITLRGKSAILVIFRDITERWHEQLAAQESARRLRTLINALPDQICFLDANQRWIEANTTLLRSVGLADVPYRGKTAQQLAEHCDPKFREHFIRNSNYPKTVFNHVTSFDYEYYSTENKLIAHQITRVPVKHLDGTNMGLVVISRDVSEHIASTRKIMESEQRYRSLFDNDSDMVLSVDTDGLILAANPSAERILGYRSLELCGHFYQHFLADEDILNSEARFSVRRPTGPVVLHPIFRRKDGHAFPAEEKRVPIIVDHEVTGFFCIIHDVTAERATEELLLQSERLTAVGQMAAGIAHEIRNPLTAVKGFVQLLQTAGNADGFYLKVMEDELNRIESIVSELLLLSKPTEPLLEQYECCQIVNEVIELMSPHANIKNILITQERLKHTVGILCDKNRLKQVLINIIKNAIEATPHSGQILVRVNALANGSISICVRDTGYGIPDTVLARMGDPFYTTKENGTGLGLMISKQIIEAHHGTLEIRSQVGVGTEVEITLPNVAGEPVTTSGNHA